MQNTRIFLAPRLTRQFFVSSINRSYEGRQGRFMEKLLRGSRSKKKWYNNDSYQPSTAMRGPKTKTHFVQTSRRTTVLNKVFMGYITDLMSTGEASAKLLDRSIEVSHVQVSPDFKIINVFWIDHTNPLEHDAVSTQELLSKCAKTLRHDLSQLRVIGVVPPIQFVKCKHVEVQREVERRLKIADYGENFVPSIYPFTPTQTIKAKISSTENITKADTDQSDNVEDVFEVVLPVMRNDTFDLDHDKIMSKIKVSLAKSREGIQKRALIAESSLPASREVNSENIQSILTEKEQKEQFAKFLVDRRREAAHKYKMKYCKKRDIGINDIQDVVEDDFNDNNVEDDFIDDDVEDDSSNYADEFYDDDGDRK